MAEYTSNEIKNFVEKERAKEQILIRSIYQYAFENNVDVYDVDQLLKEYESSHPLNKELGAFDVTEIFADIITKIKEISHKDLD